MTAIELALPREAIKLKEANVTMTPAVDPDPVGTYLDYLRDLNKAERVIYQNQRFRRAQFIQTITFGRHPNRLQRPETVDVRAARRFVSDHWHGKGVQRPANFPVKRS